MAKAALNMLTRTSGGDLKRRGIFMTSVDTGWFTDERPYKIARKLNFEPPIDEIDAASRVLHPVYQALRRPGDTPLHSVFLKDYQVAPW